MSKFSIGDRVYHVDPGPDYPATVYAIDDEGDPVVEFDELPPGWGPSPCAGRTLWGVLWKNERCFGEVDSPLRPLPVQPKPAESPTREELIARVAELEADLATVQETHARAGQLVSDLRRENERLEAETAALGQERDRLLGLLREAEPLVDREVDRLDDHQSTLFIEGNQERRKIILDDCLAADDVHKRIKAAIAAHPAQAQEEPCRYARDSAGVWHGACGKATATGSRELLPTTCAWCKRPVEVRE